MGVVVVIVGRCCGIEELIGVAFRRPRRLRLSRNSTRQELIIYHSYLTGSALVVSLHDRPSCRPSIFASPQAKTYYGSRWKNWSLVPLQRPRVPTLIISLLFNMWLSCYAHIKMMRNISTGHNFVSYELHALQVRFNYIFTWQYQRVLRIHMLSHATNPWPIPMSHTTMVVVVTAVSEIYYRCITT